MPELNAYLFFDGNCAEAMRFYERALGGKLTLMTHAEAPSGAQAPPGNADRIMHARLVIDGGGALMASDEMAGHPYAGMKEFSLSLTYPAAADAQPVFDALAEGGRVNLPFQKTFWSEGFGMLVDRFGTPWMINSGMASS
jgi:PhnB protein